jgi:hypothetical protein
VRGDLLQIRQFSGFENLFSAISSAPFFIKLGKSVQRTILDLSFKGFNEECIYHHISMAGRLYRKRALFTPFS